MGGVRSGVLDEASPKVRQDSGRVRSFHRRKREKTLSGVFDGLATKRGSEGLFTVMKQNLIDARSKIKRHVLN